MQWILLHVPQPPVSTGNFWLFCLSHIYPSNHPSTHPPIHLNFCAFQYTPTETLLVAHFWSLFWSILIHLLECVHACVGVCEYAHIHVCVLNEASVSELTHLGHAIVNQWRCCTAVGRTKIWWCYIVTVMEWEWSGWWWGVTWVSEIIFWLDSNLRVIVSAEVKNKSNVPMAIKIMQNIDCGRTL